MTIEQGPDAGRVWGSEKVTRDQEKTGTTVHQLTDSRAHDHPLYFTNPGWFEGGDRLLFASDRTGRPNLFSVAVDSGQITQVTDLPEYPGVRTLSDHDSYHYDGFPLLFTSVNPTRPEAYFWDRDSLVAVDLETASLRVLWEKPTDFDGLITNVTADGETVCTSIHQRVASGSNAFQATWEARPESRVIGVPIEGGEPSVYHAEDYWINHVNTSPTRPDLLTFCHEGPWDRIDHRIWGLDLRTGESWRIREIDSADDVRHLGHEFWLANGEDVGYHGRTTAGVPFFGVTRYDDSDHTEVTVLPDSQHFQARTRDLVVGDGGDPRSILLYELQRDGATSYELATHDCRGHVQGLHVHPRFAPDGASVVFTSDRLGYANVYLADLPADRSTLPRLDVTH